MDIYRDEHHLFRTALRDFLKRAVSPYLDTWETEGQIPRSIWNKLGDMGFLGIQIPELYGGTALDFPYLVILTEETSKINSGGFSAAIVGHVALAMVYLEKFGSDFLKQKYLPKSCEGQMFGCLAITEPNAGSDVASIRTTALKTPKGYLINGSKTFITNGVLSDYLIVAAKTDVEKKSAGISLFVLDRSTPGIRATALNKLGWKASDTAELSFEDVLIPQEHLIGEEHKGFYYIMQNFALERLILAIGAIAASETALHYTLQYMYQRKAFGRTINKFQVLRHRVAQLSAEIEMQKAFNNTICKAFDDGHSVVQQCAMAKLMSTELSDKVMTECLQCFGGYGYMEDYKIARMFRDSRLGTIGGGTSEIMRELLAKMIIDQVRY
jgi:hypothetical protein